MKKALSLILAVVLCLALVALILLAIFAPRLMAILNKKMAKPDLAETGADANSDD